MVCIHCPLVGACIVRARLVGASYPLAPIMAWGIAPPWRGALLVVARSLAPAVCIIGTYIVVKGTSFRKHCVCLGTTVLRSSRCEMSISLVVRSSSLLVGLGNKDLATSGLKATLAHETLLPCCDYTAFLPAGVLAHV